MPASAVRIGRALAASRTHSATFLAVARASATQSGMPTPRKPLPVRNRPRMARPARGRSAAIRRQVSDLVLRALPLPAVDAREDRFAGDSAAAAAAHRSRSATSSSSELIQRVGDRVRRRRSRASARGRPARGAPISTTATRPPEGRWTRRAARRSRIRCSGWPTAFARTPARPWPSRRTGSRRRATRGSASMSRISAAVTYAGVAHDDSARVERLRPRRARSGSRRRPERAWRPARSVEADRAGSARSSAATSSLSPPGSDRNAPSLRLRPALAAERLAAGCRARARSARAAETAPGSRAHRRRPRECPRAAARPDRWWPPRRSAAS